MGDNLHAKKTERVSPAHDKNGVIDTPKPRAASPKPKPPIWGRSRVIRWYLSESDKRAGKLQRVVQRFEYQSRQWLPRLPDYLIRWMLRNGTDQLLGKITGSSRPAPLAEVPGTRLRKVICVT